jgi:hypothetical protein
MWSSNRNLRAGVNVLADWPEKGLKIVGVTQQFGLAPDPQNDR